MSIEHDNPDGGDSEEIHVVDFGETVQFFEGDSGSAWVKASKESFVPIEQ